MHRFMPHNQAERFIRVTTIEPLLSQASKKFGVELSILTSQIDYAGGVKFGYTIAEVEGNEDKITQTKIYLMENNVRVEVLGYVQ